MNFWTHFFDPMAEHHAANLHKIVLIIATALAFFNSAGALTKLFHVPLFQVCSIINLALKLNTEIASVCFSCFVGEN